MSASVFVPAMARGLSSSNSEHRSLKPTTTKKTMSTVKFVTIWRNSPRESGAKQSFQIRASDDRREQTDYAAGEPRDGARIQEDLNYLWKLGAGSVVAAAAIKYGSAVFPEITRPNLTAALFIIIAPVVLSVLLLIRASYSKNHD